MTIEVRDTFEAGLDAVIADNTLNRGGFVDAMQTVITSGFSNAEGNAWVDAVAALYATYGLGNGSYSNWRNNVLLGSTKDEVLALFDSINRAITGLPETVPLSSAIELFNLREERDNIDAAMTRLDDLIAAEPGPAAVRRIVREELREAKQRLRDRKQAVRAAIQAATGDPDS